MDASSLPLVTSITCSALSQPATKVILPTTTGEPFTGPCVLNFHTSLPPRSRQYSVESCEPNRTFGPAKLAPDVISAPVSNVHFFAPVAASTQWNSPSSSPANTNPPPTLGGALKPPSGVL